MSEKRFKLIKPLGTRLGLKDIFIKDTQEDYYYNTKEDVVDLLNELSEENEQQSELELLHCLISIMKEDKRFIKLIEDKRSELAFEPYSENGYAGYRCLDKIREKLYE